MVQDGRVYYIRVGMAMASEYPSSIHCTVYFNLHTRTVYFECSRVVSVLGILKINRVRGQS